MTKEPKATYFMPWVLASALFFLGAAVPGCFSPVTLNRAVTSYDEAVTDAISKQLLINIARAQQHQPIHFTGVSNVAATFDFRFSAGATPALTGDASRALMPIFGGSVAENPTISIAPIEGEEFTRRLLTPFRESKFILLLRQRYDIDLLLRLMTQELRIRRDGQEVAYRNRPMDRAGYEMFRQVVTHLSYIQDKNQLYAEPLMYIRTWTLPAGSVTAEGFQALEKEYRVIFNQADNEYTIQKQITGPTLITNYDPEILPPDERAQLLHETEEGSEDDVTFDIRAEYVGGEYPMKGNFRLRSFNAILGFLGRSLEEDPEYRVERDSRTPPVAENPIHTMELVMSEGRPSGVDLAVQLGGKYYAVNTTGPLARWNREAFQLLYFLFQMTVSEVPRAGVPSITIAK